MEDYKFRDDLRLLSQEELKKISGGAEQSQEVIYGILFFVEVVNGTYKRTEVIDTEPYHTIPTIKKWLKNRLKLDQSCTIRLYNAEHEELIDGSLTANNIKFADYLTAIVN